MSLSIDQKKAVVSEVTQALSAAQAAVLAEYRGLTVAQITELRSEARNLGVDVRVVKNTLARRVVADSS
jgi:large subunit ribosomal protein L10